MSTEPTQAPPPVSHRTSHRQSTIPSAPLPPLTISPRAIAAEHTLIAGTHPITLSDSSVLHPFARLDSSRAPIVLAESVVVWEKACVGVGSESDAGKRGSSAGVTQETPEAEHIELDRFVVVGAGAVVEGSIGRGTDVGVGARVGRGARVGEYCKIAPLVEIPPGTRIPDHTVVLPSPGGGYHTRTNIAIRDNARVRDLLEKGLTQHVEMMRKLVKVNPAKWQ